MKLSKYIQIRHPVQGMFYLIVASLLFFGLSFSKFEVYEPFYLHDTLMIITFMLALLTMKRYVSYNKVFFAFMAIGLYYIVYSLLVQRPVLFMVRQSAIFLYPCLVFVIFQCFKNYNHQNILFIRAVGRMAIALQLMYLMYLGLTGQLQLFKSMHYFSPMAIMGIIVFMAERLVYGKRKTNLTITVACILLLSTTLGHSSAFLAVLMVLLAYLTFKTQKKQVVIVCLLIFLVLLSLVLFVPQFKDNNSSWRLIYWQMTLEKILQNGGLGHGFGVPYVTDAEIAEFVNIFKDDNDFLDSPEERYIKPMHNSFLTFAYHLGLIPLLLLLSPLFRFLKQVRRRISSRESLFLGLSLIGISVWSSFNVILELPHSAVFFWLIYFSLSKNLTGERSK